jgi:hypothetical protein
MLKALSLTIEQDNDRELLSHVGSVCINRLRKFMARIRIEVYGVSGGFLSTGAEDLMRSSVMRRLILT